MQIQQVYAVYFSATGTTARVVEEIAQTAAVELGCRCRTLDFTQPEARGNSYAFDAGDLVIFGLPVYAGRLPNLLLPFVQGSFAGGGALAVPVVLFGNRNFDDGLIELRDILQGNDFHPVAGAAFVGEHAFSRTLGAGRPNAADLGTATAFAADVAAKIKALPAAPTAPVAVDGQTPLRPYYTPRDRAGNPIDILKVKPRTSDGCNDCGLCVDLCPMGSIDAADPALIKGVCIKCGACIKGCPRGAKFYDDAGYLYHQQELEAQYAAPAEIKLFL